MTAVYYQAHVGLASAWGLAESSTWWHSVL